MSLTKLVVIDMEAKYIRIDSESIFSTVFSKRRVHVLLCLYGREMCSRELAKVLNMGFGVCSKTVKELIGMGLVKEVGIKRLDSQKRSRTYTSDVNALYITMDDDNNLIIRSIKRNDLRGW